MYGNVASGFDTAVTDKNQRLKNRIDNTLEEVWFHTPQIIDGYRLVRYDDQIKAYPRSRVTDSDNGFSNTAIFTGKRESVSTWLFNALSTDKTIAEPVDSTP